MEYNPAWRSKKQSVRSAEGLVLFYSPQVSEIDYAKILCMYFHIFFSLFNITFIVSNMW